MRIGIIDYDVGNLGSIRNMLRKAGVDSFISRDSSELARADKLILPGVGSFDYGMGKLHEFGLPAFLAHRVHEKRTPILGICLGAQLLTRGSEEGKEPGLGWFAVTTIRFRADELGPGLKVPHMGWNDVAPSPQSRLFRGLEVEPRFYFVHSYHFDVEAPEEIAGTAVYGQPFPCAMEKGNVLGVQFHPEKSHRFGLQLLKNFAELY